jgi:hypothetical protein
MSEMKHTAEPWVTNGVDIRKSEGVPMLLAIMYTGIGAELNEYDFRANAQRIVDCVNACAGMNDPATEIATLRARVAELVKAAEPEPATVRGWLEQLPDGYRERALRQCVCADEPRKSITDSLYIFSFWAATEEKEDFWVGVYNHYINGTHLPPLPEE